MLINWLFYGVKWIILILLAEIYLFKLYKLTVVFIIARCQWKMFLKLRNSRNKNNLHADSKIAAIQFTGHGASSRNKYVARHNELDTFKFWEGLFIRIFSFFKHLKNFSSTTLMIHNEIQ